MTVGELDRSQQVVRWLARGTSIVVGGWWQGILLLVLTSEDGLPPQARLQVPLLILSVVVLGAAWRWPRTSGSVVVVLALLHMVLILLLPPPVGFSTTLAIALVVPMPLLLAGVLFIASRR